MTRSLWIRFALVLVLGASAATGGCELGREVVSEYESEVKVLTCSPPLCELPLNTFRLPSFSDPARCADPGACAEVSGGSVTSGSQLRGSVLRWSTGAPISVQLNEIAMEGGALRLSGPVTLRIKESQLSDVVVWLSAPEGAAPPRLILEQSRVGTLTARSDGPAGAVGSLELERTSSSALDLEVASISAHSSSIEGARLVSRELRLVDTRIHAAELSFDEGFLASVSASDLRTPYCGDLAATLTSISGEASELGPCQELFFQTSSMVFGLIDGPIHMEKSRLSRVLVGTRVPTSLDGWRGNIDSAAFCAHTGAVRLDSEIRVNCASCEPAPAISFCHLDGLPALLGNHCPLLQGELTHCAEPVPHAVDVR